MINWQGTVISQYNQSPTIQSLLYAINQWIDPTKDLDNFYNYIWNVDTARGYGLDVWGRIVAVGRVLQLAVSDPYWGFDEATIVSAWPFNTADVAPYTQQSGGIFYQNQPLTSNYILSDDGYRTLILAKALFNITDGSIPAMNQILLNLFGSIGRAYIIDNQDMSMTYKFEFVPTPLVSAIISQSGVMPRPTGVSVSYFFGPSTAIPQHVGANIYGAGQVRATATVILKPSLIAGQGLVHANAMPERAARARLGGVGSLTASAGTYVGQLVAASARIAGAGHMVGNAPAQGAARLSGVAGLRATSGFISRVQVSARIAGQGTVHTGPAIEAVEPPPNGAHGVGTVFATAHVITAARARLSGAAGLHASVSSRFSVPLGGAGGVRASASVEHQMPAAATITGRGSVGANPAASRTGTAIHGAGNVRANGTVI